MPSTNSRAGLALRALYRVAFSRLPLLTVFATALAFSALIPAHRAHAGLIFTNAEETLTFVSADQNFTVSATTTIGSADTKLAGAGGFPIDGGSIFQYQVLGGGKVAGECIAESKTLDEWGIPILYDYTTNFSAYANIHFTFTGSCDLAPDTLYQLDAIGIGGYTLALSNETFIYDTEGYTPDAPDYVDGINSGTYNTRFLSLDITASTTVPKDVHIRTSYYIDPAEVDRTKSSQNPTLVSVSIAQKPSTSFVTYSYLIGTTTGTSSIDMTIVDANIADTGDFDVLVQFSNQGVPFGSPRPFPEAYIYSGFSLSSKALTSFLNPEFNDAVSVASLSTRPCGLTDIGGCFVNAFTYLLVPSQTSLNTFSDQFDAIWTKSPFVYPAQISGYVSSLFPTGGGSFSIGLSTDFGNVTYLSSGILSGFPFASLLRTLMMYGLWFAFAMTVYRKVSMIHEKTA